MRWRYTRWGPRRVRLVDGRECCSTCGERLLFLRWGHEDRCETFTARRRARLNRIGLVLLVLSLALMLVHR